MTIRDLAGISGLSENEVRAAIHKLMYKPTKQRALMEDRLGRSLKRRSHV